MAKKALIQQDFEGGWSTDKKSGIKNSFAFSQGFDFRKSPSQMTVLPGPAREDANVVQDLILNEVMTADGTTYSFGNVGYFYKRTTGGTWSVIGKAATGNAGIDYRQDADAIYLATDRTVGYFGPVSGTGIFDPTRYNISQSTYNNTAVVGFNVNTNQSGSTNFTNLTTSFTEATMSRRFFQSDIEPLNKVSVFVTNKGTGDFTLTLHDGLNNVLATSTVTNANLVNNHFNDFVFSSAPNSQVRIYIAPNARTYHFHLTSTVADGIVASTAFNDLSTCDLQVWADRMVVTKNGLHPIQRFMQFECIGNGNYLSVWEPLTEPPTNSEWLRHKLVFPREYEVCGLALINEFIVIAAEKNTSSSTSIPQEGQLFFWDGTSATYNYNVAIPEGSPHRLRAYKNVAYYYAGGAEWAITSPTTQPVKIRTMPGSDTTYSGAAAPITIYPYAATVKGSTHLIAYPSTTTNTGITYGVYSWGAVDKNYPDSFGYYYPISTGSQNYSASNNLSIGMLKAFGDTLHISWRDDLNGGYGIDVVNNASLPVATATWQSMIFDGGYAGKRKGGNYIEAYYSLPAGATIQMSYNIDRSGWITDPNLYSTTNLWLGHQNRARFSVTQNATSGANDGRFSEIQLQVVVNTGTAVTPATVYMVALVYDDNVDEALK